MVRAGYGIFYVPNFYGQGPNDGFSQITPWTNSLNNGLTPASTLSGNPNVDCEAVPGVPAPCGPAFTTERLPTGNSAGGLQDVGFGTTITNHSRNTPYVEQWMAGGQYSVTPNDLVDISYVGNHGTNLLATGLQWEQMSPGNLTQGNALFNSVPNPFFGHITSSSCGLNNPTIILEQTLIPFPQYCSVFEPQPAVGTSSYDALQVTYTHRWHSGLDLNVSYTYSKFRDDVQGNSGWAFPGSGTNNLYSYNLAADYSVDASNVPHRFVVSYIYDLPVGKGKHFGSEWSTPVDAVLGGWAWSGILTAESGLPLSIQPASNNVGFGFNQRPNVVPGVNPVPANRSIDNWINANAFSQPDAFTFGDAPRFFADLHGPTLLQLGHGHTKVLECHGDQAAAIPVRDVQRAQPSEFLPAGHQPVRRQLREFRKDHGSLSSAYGAGGGKILLLTPGPVRIHLPPPRRRQRLEGGESRFRTVEHFAASPASRGCAKNEFFGPRGDKPPPASAHETRPMEMACVC